MAEELADDCGGGYVIVGQRVRDGPVAGRLYGQVQL
jgi:hypothetical protein